MSVNPTPAENSNNEEYFRSYENLDVHEIMLKDKPRIVAYESFINENKELFKDKIVVDVGAGTGILSLFAAKAGARKVFAIEASNISHLCEDIVVANGYRDVITVINGRVEDVVLPDKIKADIIVSEWMGFYLLHESMLSSVLTARDKFLTPDGVLLPTTASISVAPVCLSDYYKQNFEFWKQLHGFDFSPMLSSVKLSRSSQPQIIDIEANDCIAEPDELVELDLRYLEIEDIRKVLNSFEFVIQKNSLLHGVACWFDVEFEGATSRRLSTGPSSDKTHWHQTIVLLPDALLVSKGDIFQCSVTMERDQDNPRRYNISVEIDEDEEMGSEPEQDDGVTVDNGNGQGAETLIKHAMSKDV